MVRLNTKELSARLDVSYVVAAGLLKYLVANNKAKLVDKVVTAENGLGKPIRIYEMEDSVRLDLSKSAEVSEAA